MQRTFTGILTPGQLLTSCDCTGVTAAAALLCMGASLQAKVYSGSEELTQNFVACSLMEHCNAAHIHCDSDAGAMCECSYNINL